MRGHLKSERRTEKGFTLIEIIVVLAILGILAAVLLPTVSGVLTQGDEASFKADVEAVDLAVSQFRIDRHQGPDASSEWGAGPGGKRRVYPTADGEVGNVELDLPTAPTDDNGNRRLMKYVDGPDVGLPAEATDVADALVWLGLLVNEPVDGQPSSAQQSTGGASPLDDENGEYLPDFPESAHPDNTVLADGVTSVTNGSYWYVLLHNGTTVAVYDDGTGTYWAGFGDVFP